jgi:hypothetical protein
MEHDILALAFALFKWRVNQTGILRHLNALAKFNLD